MPHSSLLYSLALGSITVAIFFGYWARSRSSSETAISGSTLPQDPAIQVYFNHDRAAEFTEPYRQKRRKGQDLAARITSEIDRARVQIDIAVQELQLPNIAQALAAKAKAGVKVRVLLEHNYSRSPSELTAAEIEGLTARERDRYREYRELVDLDRDGTLAPAELAQRDALTILKQAQIPILDDTADGSRGSGLMHHKFMVVDGKHVIVTSANWTMSDIYGDFRHPDSEGNHNHLVSMESAQLAAVFTNEFNLMWGDGSAVNNASSTFKLRKPARLPVEIAVGNTRVWVQFSPTSKQQAWEDSSNGSIGKFIASSQQQVDFALFVFSEPTLGKILQERAQQGVKVRGAIDRQFAYRDYSAAFALLGGNICQTAPNNSPTLAIGAPSLPTGDLLHHKFAVIDRHTTITGSHNWSNAANDRNDETLLIIRDNPTVAAHFDREFERLYAGVVVGIPSQVKDKHCTNPAEGRSEKGVAGLSDDL